MIQRTPPHAELSRLGRACGAWMADGVDLEPGDVLIYWEQQLPILRFDGDRAICQGWPAGFTIRPTDRWAILPRKETSRA